MPEPILVHRRIAALSPARRTLVFLHGLGDSLAGWSFLPEALDLPWLEVVLVQAPIAYGPGWSWYELDASLRSTPRTRQDIVTNREKVTALLGHLELDLSKTVLGGFSQGAVLSLETGLRLSTPLAGILPVSGYVPLLEDYPAGFGAAIAQQRILATHGDWDAVIPHAMAQTQMLELAARGAPLVFESFDKAHDIDIHDELDRIRGWISQGVEI